MSVASRKKLLAELKSKKFRENYAAEHVKTMIPIQARILREQRGLTQGQLAKRMKTTQTVISRLEDPNYGKLSLSSLLKLASGFDVALLVKFVPFSRLLHEFEDASPQALSAKEFIEELPQLEKWAAYSSQTATRGGESYTTVTSTANDDVNMAGTAKGSGLLENVSTSRNSSMQVSEGLWVAAAVRPHTSGTHSRNRRFVVKKRTAMEVSYGAAS